MFCSKCGNSLPEGAKFCNECGEKIIENRKNIEDNKSAKDKDTDSKTHPKKLINDDNIKFYENPTYLVFYNLLFNNILNRITFLQCR